MIRAILIDDEPRGLEFLQTLLGLYCPQVEILGTARRAEEGIDLIFQKKPDLVFLDIEMPYMNGFSLLESIYPITFEVIFVTAFEDYALKAFRYNALDYLVKPIDIEDLKKAVAKAYPFVANRRIEQVPPVQGDSPLIELGKVCLPIQEGLWFVNVEDIVRCEADGKYTWFYFQNKEKRLVCKNLKEYEELLPQSIFFRVHYTHLINLKFVHKYIRGKNSIIEMTDGTQVELSSRRKDVFLSHFQEFMT